MTTTIKLEGEIAGMPPWKVRAGDRLVVGATSWDGRTKTLTIELDQVECPAIITHRVVERESGS